MLFSLGNCLVHDPDLLYQAIFWPPWTTLCARVNESCIKVAAMGKKDDLAAPFWLVVNWSILGDYYWRQRRAKGAREEPGAHLYLTCAVPNNALHS